MNLALEPPGLGMSCFVKRSIKKMMGFRRGAQIQESGPGAARARNELFCYAKYQENDRFLGLEPPGLGMSCFVKRSIKKMIGFWRGP